MTRKHAYYCKLITTTLSANYAACKHMAFLNRSNLGEKPDTFIIGNTTNVKHFSNMDGNSCNVYEPKRSGERLIINLRFVNSIKLSASDGSVTRSCRYGSGSEVRGYVGVLLTSTDWRWDSVPSRTESRESQTPPLYGSLLPFDS